MSQGLSLLQAPPFIIVFGFFLTACLFGLLASLFELYLSVKGFLDLPPLVHLYTLGFALFTMFGALFQMLPVVAGAVIKKPKPKALVSYILLLLGSTFILIGFLRRDYLILLGAILTYLGIVYTSLLMLWHLFKVKAYIPAPMGFRYALGFLLLGASMGFYQVLSYFGFVPFWERAVYLHLTLLLFGWIGLLVASVSFQVVEMFFVAEPYNKSFAMNFPLMVLFCLILSYFGGFFSVPLVALFLAYSYMTLKRLIRRKRGMEPSVLFWYMSQAFLIISSLLYPFMQAYLLPFLFSFLLFFSSIIMGMMYRIIPFLVWFHLSNMPSKRVPLMFEVIPYERIRLNFYMHLLWAVCVVLSFLLKQKLGFIISSAVHIASSLFLLYNVYSGGRLYFEYGGKW
ncbi:MAG: hypothetical protein ACK4LT_03545 [Aquificaceae bacterium]